ncbi:MULTISPECIES: hypothetical protein [unclassified Aeromicrobium]|uniref:hypothetical protein n=1 Tax=unclassified Aeromicrobium TaxID=2633570 RepID=UPI0006FFE2A3|nr:MULTISPECIES: hypothetical protein [unclassified Aeromicrobium]KQO36577.1 hypothetical protein ASF05_10510 [Aeromicrobium sp. Leaf245]KQP28020.1 hypothetical protein ASF38_04400 [Aeromicrobium sp. Leaf272]KQP78213.1 hypothetical protein ASF37_06390 [Aeromicrobium sp. Leaf289]KQP83922.1 hypothetical protein ASF35_02885 [Aeromicrobium sp. Leaf291]
MNKLLIAAAGVAGYVLGTKAGRERYDQIRTQSQKVWNSPTVQSGVDHAADAAKSAAGAAGSAAADAASSAASAAGSKVVDAVKSHRSDDASSDGVSADPADPSFAIDEVADPQLDADLAEADTEVPSSPSVTTPPTAADLAEDRLGRP